MSTRPSGTSSTAKGRILLAEDELALVRSYGRTLAQAGYDVVTATDGRKARELIEHGGFDAVLSDVVMPGVTGLELLCASRRRDRRVPFIIMTGTPTPHGADEAAANGALMYLTKPVELRSLLQLVDHACKLHRRASSAETESERRGALSPEGDDLASCSARFESACSSIFMVYQAIVRPSLEVFGYETLLRSAEPTMSQPMAILAAAERLGRVHVLGRAVRDSVAATASELPANVSMFVNLHPADLADESLFSPEAPLSRVAGRVVLELTERASLDDVPDLPSRIAALRRLGFRIAVDDLGAGYASLTAFAQIHPEVVKLDMALIRDLHLEPVKRRIVSTLVAMSREMGVLVVAEGVETAEECEVLVALGCDLLQGYLFARPARWLAIAA